MDANKTKTAQTETAQLERYILFLIRDTKLFSAKTVLSDLRAYWSRGGDMGYEEVLQRLRSLKTKGEIEPIVKDTGTITPSTLWRLKQIERY